MAYSWVGSDRDDADRLRRERDDLQRELEDAQDEARREREERRREVERQREAQREEWRERQATAYDWREAFSKGIARYREEAIAEEDLAERWDREQEAPFEDEQIRLLRPPTWTFRNLLDAARVAQTAYYEEMAKADERISAIRREALAAVADRIADLPGSDDLRQAIREDHFSFLVDW